MNKLLVFCVTAFVHVTPCGDHETITQPALAPIGSWKLTAPTTATPDQSLPPGAVAAGAKILLWGTSATCADGAANASGLCGVGAAYDSVSYVWTPLSAVGAPAARFLHSVVWTGTRMLIWGGEGCGRLEAPCQSGGVYDPATDAWEPLDASAPITPRSDHTAVWTGDRMIVFGGWNLPRAFPVSAQGDGASYDPASRQWTVLPSAGAPAPREGHTAIWTGTQMIVWGGDDGTSRGDGAIYDVASARWLPMSAAGAPSPRHHHSAVWTGSEMIIWSGAGCGDGSANCGGNGRAYRPTTDSWRPIPDNASSDGRAVFTDGRMLVWGATGSGIYDPAGDAWAPMSTVGQPVPGYTSLVFPVDHGIFVWGGLQGEELVFDGGQFFLPR
ncbi:MAG: kelch repeat protein [Labilithrix sp.]|nr:kelch repeat protein [Labilithrix sp.]